MTHSNEKPARIEQLGHSLFAYNMLVNDDAIITSNEDNGQALYSYDQIIFDHKPTRNEIINAVIQKHYPYGEEAAIQRKGILDSQNPEFIAYNEFVELIKQLITEGNDEEV